MNPILSIVILLISYFAIPNALIALAMLIKQELTGVSRNSKKVPEVSFYQKRNHFNSYVTSKSEKRKLNLAIIIATPIISALLFTFVIKGTFIGILVNLVLYLVVQIVIKQINKKNYDNENRIISEMLEHKQLKMGLIDKDTTFYNHEREFKIESWSENREKPTKIVMNVPINFPVNRRVSFLGDFTETFNFDGIWTVNKETGWNLKDRTVTLEWQEFVGAKEMEFISSFLMFKKQSMGFVEPSSGLFTYNNEFEVLEWNEQNEPEKIRLYLPVGYDPLQKTAFLDKMSIQFGGGRPWEVFNEDQNTSGWDTDNRVAVLKKEKPLPGMALWDERYIKNDSVQWSYFPLGIGSKMGIPFTEPDSGEEVRLIGFDVYGDQQKWCQKNNVFADADLIPAPHVLAAGVTGGGKSVFQRNIILGCLTRPKEWQLIIVDMKKVEGAMWRKYGVPVATTYQDAALLLQYAQSIMMERFEMMELRGLNKWSDMPKETRGPAIMINVDEISELLAPIKGKTDLDKENAEYQGICNSALESIARLGRAAMVHMLVAGQRPSSDVVSMQIRQNSPVRIGAGAIPATISQMVFENGFGSTIPSSPRGRMGIRVHSAPAIKFQGFFADERWLDEYLEKHGLPTKIYDGDLMAQVYESNQIKADALDMLGDEMSDEDFDMLEL